MISVTIQSTAATEALLTKIPFEFRAKTVKKALRAAGNIVKKEAAAKVTKPGYPGDKPGAEHGPLSKSLWVRIREYKDKDVAFIGPRQDRAWYGYLVEEGHKVFNQAGDTGHLARPHPFLKPAADATKSQQQAAFVKKLKEELPKMGIR